MRLLPVPVDAPLPVTALALGASHTCAQRDDGTAWCWGRDAEGQLGDGPWAFSAAVTEQQYVRNEHPKEKGRRESECSPAL